jgi:hypothetical protein
MIFNAGNACLCDIIFLEAPYRNNNSEFDIVLGVY